MSGAVWEGGQEKQNKKPPGEVSDPWALWQDDPERPGFSDAAAETGTGGGGECGRWRSWVGEGHGSHSLLTLPLLQSSQESQESDQPKLLTSVIIGLGVALVLVLVILITALVCVRKRYGSHFSLVPSSLLAQIPNVCGVGRKNLGLGIRGMCKTVGEPPSHLRPVSLPAEWVWC